MEFLYPSSAGQNSVFCVFCIGCEDPEDLLGKGPSCRTPPRFPPTDTATPQTPPAPRLILLKLLPFLAIDLLKTTNTNSQLINLTTDINPAAKSILQVVSKLYLNPYKKNFKILSNCQRKSLFHFLCKILKLYYDFSKRMCALIEIVFGFQLIWFWAPSRLFYFYYLLFSVVPISMPPATPAAQGRDATIMIWFFIS